MFQNSNFTFNFDLTDLIDDFNQEISSIFVFSNLMILSNRFVLYKSMKKLILMLDNFKRHEKKQRKLKRITNRREKSINFELHLLKILCDLVFRKKRFVN